MIKISIIIPVHNRKKVTIKGLTSLNLALDNYYKKSKLIACDIVIIDDGSTDNTSDWVSKHYPNTNIIYGDGNLWWSGSINLGINYSLNNLNPNYIMFWNDDLTVDSDYFLNLEKIVINERFKNSIIASKIFYENEKDRVFYYGGFLDNKKASFYINREDLQNHSKEIECDWTGGMGVVFPINIFKEIGVVDNINFPQYYGDADFSLRAKDAGFKIYCHNELKLLNDRSSTGMSHNGSLLKYLQSLFVLGSSFNLKVDIRFVFKYFSVIFAIKFILKKHLSYLLKLFKTKLITAITYLFQFRLYIYNNFLNKIPFRTIRELFSKMYINFGNHSSIRSNVKILNKYGRHVTIGNNSIINEGCLFDGRSGKIVIGNNVSVSREVMIYTLEHKIDCDYFKTESGDVIINDYVWLGSRVIILPGVEIGAGSVVASGAVVTKDIPPMSVYGGIPAKLIRKRTSNLLYKLKDNHFFQ